MLLNIFLRVLAQGILKNTAFLFLLSGFGLLVSNSNSFLKLETPCIHQLKLDWIVFEMEVKIPSKSQYFYCWQNFQDHSVTDI